MQTKVKIEENGHEVLEALTDKKEISLLWAKASML